ncbi:MAG: hypothetical protein JKY52_00475 [Flavobacteriales bacterium]|nr:hypothetical protein [Flavobacteriales bacterium]
MNRCNVLRTLYVLICIAALTCAEAATTNGSVERKVGITALQAKAKAQMPTQDSERTVSVAGANNGGRRSVGQILRAGGLEMNDEGKSEYVYSYLVSIEFPNGTYQEVLCNTARFNLDVISHLKNCKKGTMVTFENVKVKLANHSIKRVADMTIEISKEAVKN